MDVRLGLAVAVVLGAALNWPRPAAPQPAEAPPTTFSAARAMAPLAEWAAAPRPAGTTAAARVRASVAASLGAAGLAVAEEPSADGRLTNLVAGAPGAAPGGVWLVAHSDSVRGAPGAADDGLGLAVVTEAARVLGAEGVPPALHVLVTDGEELGLLGAEAHVAARGGAAAAERRLMINVEARGTEGPAYMFQTAGPEAELLGAWRASGCRAQATSLAHTIYALLPNDTDFTVFRGAGWWGYDFALIDGAWRYHTPEDTVANLSPASVQAVGDCVVGLARVWLAQAERIGAAAGPAGGGVYAQLGGATPFLPAWVVRALAVGALLVHGRPRRVLAGGGAAVLGGVLAAAAGVALLFAALAAWPGFAGPPAESPAPGPLFGAAFVAGLGAGLAALRLFRRFGPAPGWAFATAAGAALLALAAPAAGYAFLPAAWGAAFRARGGSRAARLGALAAALAAGALFGPVVLGAYVGLTTRMLPVLPLVPLLGLGWLLPGRDGGSER